MNRYRKSLIRRCEERGDEAIPCSGIGAFTQALHRDVAQIPNSPIGHSRERGNPALSVTCA